MIELLDIGPIDLVVCSGGFLPTACTSLDSSFHMQIALHHGRGEIFPPVTYIYFFDGLVPMLDMEGPIHLPLLHPVNSLS